jgi:hypothetical protein
VANRQIVKHAVASNSLLEGILQRIYRLSGLKTSNSAQNAQKFLLAQGTEQGFQGISRQSFEPTPATRCSMTTGIDLAAK